MGETKNQDGQSPSTGSNLVGGLFLLGIGVGLFFLICGLVPADLPPDKGANFIDSIFHNKGVVLAARLLLVSAAIVLAMGGVFIMVSMAGGDRKAASGKWMTAKGCEFQAVEPSRHFQSYHPCELARRKL